MEKDHDKGLPEDSDMKASEGVLYPLEAIFFLHKIVIKKCGKVVRKMKSRIFFYSKIFSKLQATEIYNSIRGAFYVHFRTGITSFLMMMVVFTVYFFGFLSAYAEPYYDGESENFLSNGSFEEGTTLPLDWIWDAWQPSAIPTWDNTNAQRGEKSIKIFAPTPNDARWIQMVDVEPDKLYFLSGWIKTDNVGHSAEPVDAGANLCLYGTWTRSSGVFGTQDWTRHGILFNSDNETQVTVGARLGYWAGTTTGTAWFDNLELKPIVPMDPHPSWKILVLIYQDTDFEVTDNTGTYHHYVASMTQDEMEQAALAAEQFVEIDIPALTSGNMVPEITVRFPDRVLNELSAIGGGYWPSPEDTAPERDPGFDSVFVIWDPRATDLTTNNYEWIGYGDGLAANMGTGQTYFSMQIDAAVYRGHRNVFKHEWGHCILFYFNAVGTSPKPTVSNHAEATDYVNCQTGQFYVWQDETLANPIPNSIYSNESGFTHDYYSGTTATADQPSRCLGITPEAWALGGPISHSGNINQPPEVICLDVTVSTQSGLCSANASIDGGSFDPDGDDITIEQTPPGPYDLGDTDVILTVTDDEGAYGTCEATVTVVDDEVPVISSIDADPNKLWPPNHKMVPVTVAVDATDNCDSEPFCLIASVASNEPVNGLGDGDTAPDWLITGDLTVKLRAERSGNGNVRIYTITVECADSFGNSSSEIVTVTVPHDKGQNDKKK